MDFEILNNIKEDFEKCEYKIYFPEIVNNLDLSFFEKHRSSVKGFDFEYISIQPGIKKAVFRLEKYKRKFLIFKYE